MPKSVDETPKAEHIILLLHFSSGSRAALANKHSKANSLNRPSHSQFDVTYSTTDACKMAPSEPMPLTMPEAVVTTLLPTPARNTQINQPRSCSSIELEDFSAKLLQTALAQLEPIVVAFDEAA